MSPRRVLEIEPMGEAHNFSQDIGFPPNSCVANHGACKERQTMFIPYGSVGQLFHNYDHYLEAVLLRTIP